MTEGTEDLNTECGGMEVSLVGDVNKFRSFPPTQLTSLPPASVLRISVPPSSPGL
jgi:hypothetical protein